MKATTKERLFWWIAIPALAGVLLALGVLQYRWSQQVSDATKAQMQSSLQTSLMGFRQDLSRELGAACLELRPSGDDTGRLLPAALSEQFQHWQQTAAHPSLIEQVYLWRNTGASPSLLRLDPNRGTLEAVTWPAGFDLLRQHLEAMPLAVSHTMPGAAHHRGRARPGQATRRVSDSFLPWFVDQSIPALVYPWRQHANSADPTGSVSVAWVIIQLNPATLEKEIFPELTQKYFRTAAGFDYKVAVLASPDHGPHVLYSSVAGFGENQSAAYDADLNLFGPPFRRGDATHPGADFAAGRGLLSPRPQTTDERRAQALDRPVRLEPFPYSAEQGIWQIVVKHQRGSVEAAVNNLRRRHLIASFGVLVLLAVTMSLVLIASQRVRRLAALQMNFVAGVSHELRTPLAVISSAAENIAHGVVSDPQQLARYSASILKQTRQLTQLVEQVLFFAATQQKMGQYQLRSVDVGQVIDAALEDTAGMVTAAGIHVERYIESGLPAVAADFAGLSQCLQNLITNAVKYGGDQRWIGVRASAERHDGQVRGIEITVQDRGIGISAQEIKHIFEPFYRSPAVAGSNVHGTGLGLPLARTVIEAMRGRLTVESEPGRGSSFTIHLVLASGLPLPDPEAAPSRIPEEAAGSYPS